MNKQDYTIKDLILGVSQGIAIFIFIFALIITAYHYTYMNDTCTINITGIKTEWGTKPYSLYIENVPFKSLDSYIPMDKRLFNMVEIPNPQISPFESYIWMLQCSRN